MRKSWKSITVFSTLIFLMVCIVYKIISRNEKEYMSRKLGKKELLGTWYFSEKTRNLLKREGLPTRYLTRKENKLLLNDNSFECKIALPSYVSERIEGHFLLKGKWEITYEQEGKVFKNILCLNTFETTPGNTLINLHFYITEIKGNLQLWKYLKGDDSAAMVYVFEKDKSNVNEE